MSDIKVASSGRVNILYQSSGLYAPVMGVSLTSLLENNGHIEAMDIYIIDGGIGDGDKAKIRELCARWHRDIIFLSGSKIDELLLSRGISKWRNSYAVYYKLYALDMIEKPIERLLAVDADTIINQKIDSLYYADLDGKILGMVQDFMPASYMKKIGMKAEDTYYNSGIVLFDVKRWKKTGCHDNIEQFLKGNLDRILYADQDAISIVLQPDIKKLPIAFNCYANLFALKECLSFDLERVYKLYDMGDLHQFYPASEMWAAQEKAVVYHYEGGTVAGRPWIKGEHYSIFALWEKYQAMSPWKDMEKWNVQPSKIHTIEKKLNRLLPLPVFSIIYKLAYRLYWHRVLKIRPNNS